MSRETFLQKTARRCNRLRNKAWTQLLRRLGPLLRIHLGRGTIVHWGATLSTQFGGSIRLGDSCEIQPSARLVTYGGDIALGDHCSVNYNVVIYGHGGVNIGKGVRIATGSTIIPANHTFEAPDIPIHRQPETREGIVVEDDVWIAAGAAVLDGVRIARGCVIAAGAVVTKSTEPLGVYAGVPARRIKSRGDEIPAKLESALL